MRNGRSSEPKLRAGAAAGIGYAAAAAPAANACSAAPCRATAADIAVGCRGGPACARGMTVRRTRGGLRRSTTGGEHEGEGRPLRSELPDKPRARPGARPRCANELVVLAGGYIAAAARSSAICSRARPNAASHNGSARGSSCVARKLASSLSSCAPRRSAPRGAPRAPRARGTAHAQRSARGGRRPTMRGWRQGNNARAPSGFGCEADC